MAQASKKRKIFDGRYEILSIVGRGACSVVYRAKQLAPPFNEVALKVLINKSGQGSNTDRLRKEALALVSSRHKYVVRLDDFHSVDALCYLCMEYAPESDLRVYTTKHGGKLPVVQAQRFLFQISEALAFIHEAGITHRDVKPDNILVVNDRQVRLADFGVAVLPGERSSVAELEKGIGTMDYMAPEVFEGKSCDARSDVYCLAVTFYELFSGVQPFVNIPLARVLEARKSGQFPHITSLVPEIPEFIADTMMRALAFEAEQRFPTAKEFLRELLKGQSFSGKGEEKVEPKLRFDAPKPAPAILRAPEQQPVKPQPITAPITPPTPETAASAHPVLGENTGTPGSARRRRKRRRKRNRHAPLGETQLQGSDQVIAQSAIPVEASQPQRMPVQPQVERPPVKASPTPEAQQNRGMGPTPAATRESVPTEVIPSSLIEDIKQASRVSKAPPRQEEDFSVQIQESAQPVSEQRLHVLPGNRSPQLEKAPIREELESTVALSSDVIQKAIQGSQQPHGYAGMKESRRDQERLPERRVDETNRATRERDQAQRNPRSAITSARTQYRKKNLTAKIAVGVLVLLVALHYGLQLLGQKGIGDIASNLVSLSNNDSPLPHYAGQPLSFPHLPAGMYAGALQGLIAGQTIPLTIISFPESRELVFFVGLEGWTPASVKLESADQNSSQTQRIRLSTNGFVLQITGTASDSSISGSIKNVITDQEGTWTVQPVS